MKYQESNHCVLYEYSFLCNIQIPEISKPSGLNFSSFLPPSLTPDLPAVPDRIFRSLPLLREKKLSAVCLFLILLCQFSSNSLNFLLKFASA